MNLAPPSPQKAAARPISFLLDDRAFGGGPVSVGLVIRPEDLTRVDNSRLSVQQTLGSSVWADNFGPGVPSITISGHTGWRRVEGEAGDGLDRFTRLHETVFKQWHERRRQAANNGLDPDNVQLVFADALDNIAAVVAPMSFTLRRSKSRPLLAQYQIQLSVLSDEPGRLPATSFSDYYGYLTRTSGTGAVSDVVAGLGLESLTASVNKITAAIQSVRGFLTGTILAPLTAFMNQTARLYGAVRGAISAASSTAGVLISIAQTTARAGVNVFRTLAAVASLPQIAKQKLMEVAGAYSNIFCVLSNAFRQKIFYQDYSDVYGASNCSSTSGGRPLSSLAGVNPFYLMVPTSEPAPVQASAEARSSMLALANSDPALAPMSMASLEPSLRSASTGFVVS